MSRSRKLSARMAVLIVAALLLAACGPKSAPPPSTPAPGSIPGPQKPAVGGTLNLRLAKDPDNFNPILTATAYGGEIAGQVYATLFEFDEKWQPKPYVADTWSPSADGLTWNIKLKQGVMFHDGNELTADDVVYTLAAVMDKDYAGPRSGSVAPLKAVSASDRYTVKIDLKEPYAPLLENINFGILEKALFQSTAIGEMDKNPVTWKPVGAGPYKFAEYQRGQYVLLQRNDNWFRAKEFGGAPFIQTLRYKVIGDDNTAVAALENGEIDEDTPLASAVGRLIVEDRDKLTPVNYERNGWGYITINVSRPLLKDKLVRQALTYGLDRKSIIDAALDGRAVIPSGPIPPVSWAADPTQAPLPYDQGKARQLLEQAGYVMGANGIYAKGGQPLTLKFYASSGSSQVETLTQIAKKNWKDIGVDVQVQLMDFNALMDNYLKPGNFDLTFSAMGLGLDPDSEYSLFSSTEVNGFNRGRYNNPQVDQLLKDGRRESDPAKRKAIYAQFQKVVSDDCPIILIYSNKYTDMVSTKVKGGVVNYPGSGAAFIYRWYLNAQ